MCFAFSSINCQDMRQVNMKLKFWKKILESIYFKLSEIKIKYLKCKFSDVSHIVHGCEDTR